MFYGYAFGLLMAGAIIGSAVCNGFASIDPVGILIGTGIGLFFVALLRKLLNNKDKNR